MAKRKKSIRRRRRVGAISKSEVSSTLMNGAYAVVGAISANILAGAINKDKKKYMSSLPQLILGVGLSLTKNPMAKAIGVGMMVPGVQNLLKDFGVSVPGMAGVQGVGLPRLGYNPTMGAVAATGTEEMVYG